MYVLNHEEKNQLLGHFCEVYVYMEKIEGQKYQKSQITTVEYVF